MLIFPAIDLYEGKAVRLLRGDYAQMTVYSEDPLAVANDFVRAGASWVHLVDLEGAKNGTTPNLSVVERIAKSTPLLTEIGGGIRDIRTIEAYFAAGVDRVILGTAALTDKALLREAVAKYEDRIAVGADVKNGKIAIKGWLETSETDIFDFCREMSLLGVRTVICTDISKDGAMQGANHALYRELSARFPLQFVASGGVSSMEDVERLAGEGLYGAIVGKAYYTGAISLKEAIEVALK